MNFFWFYILLNCMCNVLIGPFIHVIALFERRTPRFIWFWLIPTLRFTTTPTKDQKPVDRDMESSIPDMKSAWHDAFLYRWGLRVEFNAKNSGGSILSSCSGESASYEQLNGKVCLPGPYQISLMRVTLTVTVALILWLFVFITF